MSVLAILRTLARPLGVLAVALVLVGTVLPLSSAGAGAFCLPGGTEGLPATHCDACLPVALAALPPALPAVVRLARAVEAAAQVLLVRQTRRERVWIRGPPHVAAGDLTP